MFASSGRKAKFSNWSQSTYSFGGKFQNNSVDAIVTSFTITVREKEGKWTHRMTFKGYFMQPGEESTFFKGPDEINPQPSKDDVEGDQWSWFISD